MPAEALFEIRRKHVSPADLSHKVANKLFWRNFASEGERDQMKPLPHEQELVLEGFARDLLAVKRTVNLLSAAKLADRGITVTVSTSEPLPDGIGATGAVPIRIALTGRIPDHKEIQREWLTGNSTNPARTAKSILWSVEEQQGRKKKS